MTLAKEVWLYQDNIFIGWSYHNVTSDFILVNPLRITLPTTYSVIYFLIISALLKRELCFSSIDVRGVVVIVVGNGHGDTSSNPGRDWLHFT